MPFQIIFSNKSAKFLKNLDFDLTDRIIEKIELLKSDPFPHKCIRVVGEEKTFRIRIGKYRVLYEVYKEKNEIFIADIDKRERVYD